MKGIRIYNIAERCSYCGGRLRQESYGKISATEYIHTGVYIRVTPPKGGEDLGITREHIESKRIHMYEKTFRICLKCNGVLANGNWHNDIGNDVYENYYLDNSKVVSRYPVRNITAAIQLYYCRGSNKLQSYQ